MWLLNTRNIVIEFGVHSWKIMAKSGRFKSNLITHEFEFEEGLDSKVRGKLIIEVIKYLMYQRQQLPLALDQLKRHISLNEDTMAKVCLFVYICTVHNINKLIWVYNCNFFFQFQFRIGLCCIKNDMFCCSYCFHISLWLCCCKYQSSRKLFNLAGQ
jgi:hypothetical protein